MFRVPNQFRIRTGELGSNDDVGTQGAFMIPESAAHKRPAIAVIASFGGGWEHVSASTHFRCPTWGEMCTVKDLFWDEEDCVVQYHPPASTYVNNHPYCLHLWRPIGIVLPTPPSIMVGYR